MEKKMWIWLIVVIGMFLTTVSGPVFGAQLAINSNDPMLYGRPIANQWASEIMGNYFSFSPAGEIITWETQKMGMGVIPYFKNRPQWDDTPADMAGLPSDSAARRIFQSKGLVWSQNWATEEIFSDENLFPSKENQAEEEDDNSGLPPLPNALWLCGFGIIGILSVRRTSDHSNVT